MASLKLAIGTSMKSTLECDTSITSGMLERSASTALESRASVTFWKLGGANISLLKLGCAAGMMFWKPGGGQV